MRVLTIRTLHDHPNSRAGLSDNSGTFLAVFELRPSAQGDLVQSVGPVPSILGIENQPLSTSTLGHSRDCEWVHLERLDEPHLTRDGPYTHMLTSPPSPSQMRHLDPGAL